MAWVPRVLTLFFTGNLANYEDPDKMQHNMAFHQDLHCLQRVTKLFAKTKPIFRDRNAS